MVKVLFYLCRKNDGLGYGEFLVEVYSLVIIRKSDKFFGFVFKLI